MAQIQFEDSIGVLSFFHGDALGSVVMTTNSTGAVMITRQYDWFGIVQTGVSSNGVAFTGEHPGLTPGSVQLLGGAAPTVPALQSLG